MDDNLKEQATDYLYCGMIKFGEGDFAFAIEYLESAKGIASEEDVELKREIFEWLFKSYYESAKSEREHGLLAEQQTKYGEALAHFNVATKMLERATEVEERISSTSTQSSSLTMQVVNDYVRVQELYNKKMSQKSVERKI